MKSQRIQYITPQSLRMTTHTEYKQQIFYLVLKTYNPIALLPFSAPKFLHTPIRFIARANFSRKSIRHPRSKHTKLLFLLAVVSMFGFAFLFSLYLSCPLCQLRSFHSFLSIVHLLLLLRLLLLFFHFCFDFDCEILLRTNAQTFVEFCFVFLVCKLQGDCCISECFARLAGSIRKQCELTKVIVAELYCTLLTMTPCILLS